MNCNESEIDLYKSKLRDILRPAIKKASQSTIAEFGFKVFRDMHKITQEKIDNMGKPYEVEKDS